MTSNLTHTTPESQRIRKRFEKLKSEDRAGLVTFITANHPNYDTCEEILKSLPESGADFIELGMPFSDPVADGPVIQMASEHALTQNASVENTLNLAKSLRVNDTDTPIILMGYYNPIYSYGTERFIKKAQKSGVDGLIIVDLPPEEDSELNVPARNAGLDIIRLVTPVTDEKRLATILDGASGFIYYVSITGVTGTASADMGHLSEHISMIRQHTNLPIAIGFGINTANDVSVMSNIGDAVVVGSAIVKTAEAIGTGAKTHNDLKEQIKDLSSGLTQL